ncbi:MAG TPA: glycosyltransferase family 4 protein [Thermoleophilaceae bacterium]|nr:glycosyltransferase family 4 protein [Thermoleophilaceae bacterium]
MRILYLHQFFVTREGTGGTRSYEFARQLVADGHAVTMVTAGSGGQPAGGDPAAGRGRRRLTSEREVEGIRVIEARGGYGDYVTATGMGYGRRIGAFVRFAIAATVAALRGPRPDVVFATSPPLTIALPAIAAARRWRAPLVFEVRDLWPEAPIQMGALPSPTAQRFARWIERTVYRAATEIVALSPGMRDGIAATGVAPDRIALIPNASDLDLFTPALDPGDLRERLGLGDAFVCSYFGTMGEANDLTQVLDAAALLRERDEDDVRFVLQGDGKRRQALERDVRERGLDNVVLLPAADKLAAARLAAASDACMTIFKQVPILATNSPNKLFDTFAAGRPAIVNTDGWQRTLVEQHEAGVFARPGDPADLARQVLLLRDDPDLARRMGENARRLAEREFDRRLLAGRLRGVLERAAGGSG